MRQRRNPLTIINGDCRSCAARTYTEWRMTMKGETTENAAGC